MKYRTHLSAFLIFATGACGAAVPRELADARSGFQRTSQGPTAQLNPAGLHTAKQVLAAAEHSYAEEGATQETKDLAYVAQRQTQSAEVRGRELAWLKEAEQAKERQEALKSAQLEQTTDQLSATQAQLKQKELALVTAQERRAEAERRLAETNALLQKFASVQQESRGMVITLSGNVLFVTNSAKLLPGAQVKLAEVARALTQQDPESAIVVEGHADSQGEAEMNMTLSQERAESVRTYLIGQGISADRITAQGVGEERPIADNTSPEGRANNRRVEIVVKPKP